MIVDQPPHPFWDLVGFKTRAGITGYYILGNLRLSGLFLS